LLQAELSYMNLVYSGLGRWIILVTHYRQWGRAMNHWCQKQGDCDAIANAGMAEVPVVSYMQHECRLWKECTKEEGSTRSEYDPS
jgi:hypothetical protein